jgi:hypothetical protein
MIKREEMSKKRKKEVHKGAIKVKNGKYMFKRCVSGANISVMWERELLFSAGGGGFLPEILRHPFP